MRFITQSVIVSAIALAGCATPAASPMLDAEGQPIWVISCGGGNTFLDDNDGLSSLWQGNRLQSCFRKAEEVCPTGYRLVDAEQSQGSASGSASGSFNALAASYRQSVDRTVIVRCETPSASAG